MDIKKSYRDGKLQVSVLHGINVSVGPKQSLAIMGASGSGKSTLLHILGGLDKPTSGSVHVMGVDINTLSETKRSKWRNRHLGFVYQFHHILPEFNALENVAMPLLIGGASVKLAKARAKKMLNAVGLSHRFAHKVGELSGGERQRVAIARALVKNPACVLADEPTGNLDQQTAAQVIDLMLSLNHTYKASLIVVTHDKYVSQKMDRVLTLTDGILNATHPCK